VEAPLAKRIEDSDYVHDDKEEAAAIEAVCIIIEAEVAAWWRREEAKAVRQVRAFEATQKEAEVRCVKIEHVILDDG
jgi:hypothetical protein